MNDKICWVLTDGRRGIENQALGLAEAVGLPFEVRRVGLRFPWGLMPAELFQPLLAAMRSVKPFARPRDHIDPPWPDLLICAGRASIPFALVIKQINGDRTFTVQMQKPRVHVSGFDLVVPPRHDLLTGPNVIPILGSPNRISAEKLRQAAARFSPAMANMPRPLVAVLIGGKSKHHRMPAFWMENFCDDLAAFAARHKAGLMITTSRRTGTRSHKLLRRRLDGPNIYFWDGLGENPYIGMLALADFIIVTSDSVNMITEAAATGKPVYIVDLPGGSAKFRRFYEDMTGYGAIRPFDGSLARWEYPPLHETERVAAIIRQRLAGQPPASGRAAAE